MKKQGFTLVELLAVVVILAIILAIAVPSISNIIESSAKASFESDAKMVLKAVDYKKLEDSSFKETDVNQDSINELLKLSNANYFSLKIVMKDTTPIITIVGKNKWNGLVACGSYTNIKLVEDEGECKTDFVPPTLTLNGGSTITIGEGETYSDMGATATDDVDGDITANIVKTGSINTSLAGTYMIMYTVADVAGNISTLTRTVTVLESYAGPNFKISKGVNAPNLAGGMVPIKWDGTKWIDTTTTDIDWYNYTNTDKKWANARTADGSMWVWIPRYIYKISSGWHTATAGAIDVQFSKGTNDNWNSSIIGNVDTGATSNSSNNKWTNHPAFTFGGTELTGIWIAKFEATAAEGVANVNAYPWSCPSTADDVTTKTVKIVPNAKSWKCIQIGNAFTAVRNMETKSIYGWTTASGLNVYGDFTTDNNNINTHLIKNTEWGAVSYLSKSNYGQETNEIWINPSDDFTTGCAGDSASSSTTSGCLRTHETPNGQKASTTGNIYGVYDLSGGVSEYIAAYVDNGNTNFTKTIFTNIDSKYKNPYTKPYTDNQTNNYALTVNFKGDAIYETSNAASGLNSWSGDYSFMPYTDNPWFIRGGRSNFSSGAGLFHFYLGFGGIDGTIGFRPVLAVNAGL